MPGIFQTSILFSFYRSGWSSARSADVLKERIAGRILGKNSRRAVRCSLRWDHSIKVAFSRRLEVQDNATVCNETRRFQGVSLQSFVASITRGCIKSGGVRCKDFFVRIGRQLNLLLATKEQRLPTIDAVPPCWSTDAFAALQTPTTPVAASPQDSRASVPRAAATTVARRGQVHYGHARFQIAGVNVGFVAHDQDIVNGCVQRLELHETTFQLLGELVGRIAVVAGGSS